jgi:hypothetical protein
LSQPASQRTPVFDGPGATHNFQIEILEDVFRIGHVSRPASDKAQKLAVTLSERRDDRFIRR